MGQGKAKVEFSDIKWGPLGSTTNDSPTPSPPSPPSPPSGGCCSWDGKYCGDTTDYCKASASQCEDCLPPFTTAAPPSPAPSPSGCPGGSLNACIDLCPADVFAQCVESCKSRCDSVLI